MKRIRDKYRVLRILVWSWMVFIVCAITLQARADDVYNFYFQKSPQGTIQNGTQSSGQQAPTVSVSEPTTNANQPSAPAAAISQAQLPEIQQSLPKWEIGVSYGFDLGDDAHASYGSFGGGYAGSSEKMKSINFTAQYNFSRLFGLRLGYALVDVDRSFYSWNPTQSVWGGSSWNSSAYSDTSGLFSLGAMLTMVRIDAKSHDFLTLGVGAGVTQTLMNDFKPFVEPEFSLFFSRSFGARATFKYVQDNSPGYVDPNFEPADTKVLNVGLVARF